MIYENEPCFTEPCEPCEPCPTTKEIELGFFPIQYPAFVRDVCQRAAPLLNTQPQNLHVWAYWPSNNSKVRDQPLKSIPLIDNGHFVIQGPAHRKQEQSASRTCSITLYACSNDRNLHYVRVMFNLLNGSSIASLSLILVKKGELFKVSRHFWRRKAQKCSKPVLEPGLFEAIHRHTLGFLKLVPRMKTDNVRMNRGIVLSGKPGNGKTMLCRWIEQQALSKGLAVQHIKSSQIENAYANGQLEDLVSCAPVIIFDDVDVSYFSRSDSGGNARICCALLSALDGLNQSSYRVRIFATNEELNIMDPAFLRPGRIDATFVIKAPNAAARREIIQSWKANTFNVEELVRNTENWSGAEINAIYNFMMLHYYETGEWNVAKAYQTAIDARPDVIDKKPPLGFHT